MRGLFVVGRTIFGGFFVYSGIKHFMRKDSMTAYASSKGVPSADAAVQAMGGMLIAGGLSVVSGFKPRRGLAAIVGFLVPVTLQMHRFWEEQEPGRHMVELTNFSKNL